MRTRFLVFFAGICCAAPCADNVLTPAERSAGFQLLFDGKSMRGWRSEAAQPASESSWVIEDGVLRTRPQSRPVGLLTEESYGDFELTFDWLVSAGANSGVKYRVQRVVCFDEREQGTLNHETNPRRCDQRNTAPEVQDRGHAVGFEFQLLGRDEAKGKPYSDRRFATGALYAMIPPSALPARPPGEWNQARLIVKGTHVEHWINNVRVVDGSLASEEARAGVASRFPAAAAFRDVLLNPKPGPICLQHHGGSDIRFKNLKIRRL